LQTETITPKDVRRNIGPAIIIRPVIDVPTIHILKPTKEKPKILAVNNPQLHVNNPQPEVINVDKIIRHIINDRMQSPYGHWVHIKRRLIHEINSIYSQLA